MVRLSTRTASPSASRLNDRAQNLHLLKGLCTFYKCHHVIRFYTLGQHPFSCCHDSPIGVHRDQCALKSEFEANGFWQPVKEFWPRCFAQSDNRQATNEKAEAGCPSNIHSDATSHNHPLNDSSGIPSSRVLYLLICRIVVQDLHVPHQQEKHLCEH